MSGTTEPLPHPPAPPTCDARSGPAGWMEHILSDLGATASEQHAYERIVDAVRDLGFEYCSYCLYSPWPCTRPTTYLLTNFPKAWRLRDSEARRAAVASVVRRMRAARAPRVDGDSATSFVAPFCAETEAQAQSPCHGYSLAAVCAGGTVGMMSMARTHEVVAGVGLEHPALKMRWLVNVAHQTLSGALLPKLSPDSAWQLTEREVEILKWVADGKTSTEISMILLISVHTVNFHVKNAVIKLDTSNKTAAVARAAMLGLLV